MVSGRKKHVICKNNGFDLKSLKAAWEHSELVLTHGHFCIKDLGRQVQILLSPVLCVWHFKMKILSSSFCPFQPCISLATLSLSKPSGYLPLCCWRGEIHGLHMGISGEQLLNSSPCYTRSTEQQISSTEGSQAMASWNHSKTRQGMVSRLAKTPSLHCANLWNRTCKHLHHMRANSRSTVLAHKIWHSSVAKCKTYY